MVFKNLNLLYLRPPKTASHSIATSLAIKETGISVERLRDLPNDVLKELSIIKDSIEIQYHVPVREISNIVLYNNFTKILSIRHPYERAVSEFKFQLLDYHKVKNNPAHIRKDINMAIQDESLWKFSYPKHEDAQSDYYFEDSLVIRFETIDEDWNTLQKYINIDLGPLPHTNKGRPTQIPLSRRSKDVIYEKYKVDFDLFDYKR